MLQPNLNQEIDSPVAQSGSDEGYYLDDLTDGTVVEIETQNRHYRLVKRADTHVLISGHPTVCPEPVEVEIVGSFGSGPPFISHQGFIGGRGMCLVFKHPLFDTVTTSRIREIHKLG
jgi:hypothetical protein